MDTKTDLLIFYQWKNRILVVFSDSKDNPLFQRQMQLFFKNQEELQERDLVIFQVFEKEGIMPNQKPISSSDIEKLKKRFDFSFEYDKIENKSKNKFAVFW